VKLALAQIDTTPGDLAGNRARCGRMVDEALRRGAQVVVLPELSLCGYPPRELLMRDHFVAQNRLALMTFAASVYKIGVVVGFVDNDPFGNGGPRRIYNAVATIKNGQIVSVHHKSLLAAVPGFDEARYFTPAERVRTVIFDGRTLGISIGSDIDPAAPVPPEIDPIGQLAEGGADVLINAAAAPFTLGARGQRVQALAAVARAWERPVCSVNQVGGNDELIFPGCSIALDEKGEVLARAREFAEDLVVVDIEDDTGELHDGAGADEQAVIEGLCLALRDYVEKCGFGTVAVGLSGGIDSAVTAALAVRALGPERVYAVNLPSRFSSPESEGHARALAEGLGIRYDVISIEPAFCATLGLLGPSFRGASADVTEENLQARLRMLLLMALSNKLGHLVLSTANKTDRALGFGTLYGDLAGGFAPLGDVPKTMIYRLAAALNRDREVIPAAILGKAPSGELRPDQTDAEMLPPYEQLDALLDAHRGRGLDETALVHAGFDATVVRKVLDMVARAEYKRRQAPLAPRVTSAVQGADVTLPVACRWRG
jgi:NAD+ synthetase